MISTRASVGPKASNTTTLSNCRRSDEEPLQGGKTVVQSARSYGRASSVGTTGFERVNR